MDLASEEMRKMKMRRFIFEEVGTDSYTQNMRNQNESMLVKYGLLSRSLSRGRRKRGGEYFMIEKALVANGP